MTAGVPFKYQSGEEVKCGDRVLFHGEAGRIEFVADAAVQDETTFVVEVMAFFEEAVADQRFGITFRGCHARPDFRN